MGYKNEGRGKQVVGVGFGGNVKWLDYKRRLCGITGVLDFVHCPEF
jgi:hypothetical protein